MKKILAAFVLLQCLVATLFAQDGSPLSAQGPGAFTSFAGDRSAGMGNAGLALIENGYLNRLNPATWSGLENVQATGTYGFSGVTSQDNTTNLSSYYANGTFGGGLIAVPIARSLGISMAAGFAPMSSYQYKINATYDSTANVPQYSYQKSGSGGLGEGLFGLSFSPINEISIGGMFRYAFGRMQSIGNVTFSNTAYQGSFSDNSVYLRGPAGSFGVIIGDLDKITTLKFLSGLDIGAYYRSSYNLAGSYELNNIYSDGLDTIFSQPANGYIPSEIGVGISKRFNNHFVAVLDVRSQQLSKYRDTFTHQGSFDNTLFVGGGIELLQGRDIGYLFDRRIIRAGLYYEKTQFSLPTKTGSTQQVDELFGTAGIELPVSRSATVDIAAQYGFRGLSSDLLLHERVFRLYVSFTFGEVWFIRPVGD